jgi:hypothetical protein
MKLRVRVSFLFIVAILFPLAAHGQTAHVKPVLHTRPAAPRNTELGQTAVVIDETLSVLRDKPSLMADPIQRMHRGRRIQIMGIVEADGVKFYRVMAPPSNFGWVQSDAVFGKFRAADEERLAKLVQASSGFEQIETAVEFFNLYPDSKFRPSILLLFGDLIEEASVKLTKDASSKLKRSEMAASAAPVHSYYLNFVSLDRYRKLGISFLFNSTTRQFHYDGSAWNELIKKYPAAPEAEEAKKRIETLKAKMESPK